MSLLFAIGCMYAGGYGGAFTHFYENGYHGGWKSQPWVAPAILAFAWPLWWALTARG